MRHPARREAGPAGGGLWGFRFLALRSKSTSRRRILRRVEHHLARLWPASGLDPQLDVRQGRHLGTSGLQAGPSTISCLSPISCPFSRVRALCCSSRAFPDTRLHSPAARHAHPRHRRSARFDGDTAHSRPTDRSLARKRCSLPPGVLTGAGSSVLLATWGHRLLAPRFSLRRHQRSTLHRHRIRHLRSGAASDPLPVGGVAKRAHSSRKSPCCSCFVAT